MFPFLPNEILLLILDNTKRDRDFLNFYIVLYKIAGKKHRKRARNIKIFSNVLNAKIKHYKDMIQKIGKDCEYFDYVPKIHPKFLYENDHGKTSYAMFMEMLNNKTSFCKVYRTITHPSLNFPIPKSGDFILGIKFVEKCDVRLCIDDNFWLLKNTNHIKFGYGLKIAFSRISVSPKGMACVVEYFIFEDAVMLTGKKHRCVIQDKYVVEYNPNQACYKIIKE